MGYITNPQSIRRNIMRKIWANNKLLELGREGFSTLLLNKMNVCQSQFFCYQIFSLGRFVENKVRQDFLV